MRTAAREASDDGVTAAALQFTAAENDSSACVLTMPAAADAVRTTVEQSCR
jgi:hypothetical protein